MFALGAVVTVAERQLNRPSQIVIEVNPESIWLIASPIATCQEDSYHDHR